ncbi:MAG: 2-oxoglutarate dehydrogenase E1 component [Candidatus Sericytochromatia bacterium]|nr:2-oxoglutarate dehydrogenase E1 component [Candidatus Sericytochromatia bacterium]
MDKYSYISNAHVDYIDELYKLYKNSEQSVDTSWQNFFEGFDFSQNNSSPKSNDINLSNNINKNNSPLSQKEINVHDLIQAYRNKGHLQSKTNPIRDRRNHHPQLELSDFGLSDSDLETVFDVGQEIGLGSVSLKEIIKSLKKIYEGNIGYEYNYIKNPEIKNWLMNKIEKESLTFEPSNDYKQRILTKLNESVVFENFLHTKYVGQKRFSLEGGESTIPAIDAIINLGAELGLEEVVIGMAHRGRLNVLANIMGKTYEQIFNEFEGTATPDVTMGDGDVKYHMGYSSELITPNGKKVSLKLAPNPSHLEAVSPVVEGFVRSKAYNAYNKDYNKIMPILIHGDAALAGQGIVYEVSQMADLEGYYTGGTIHFVINNQVGFTTDFYDARSSVYCTDVAKLTDAPVIHVNGDNPESVVFAVRMATEYRQKFHKDIFIDMVCYRKYGHNESDEPRFTQPLLYEKISKHKNPREVYSQELISRGEIDSELAKKMESEFRALLQDRLNFVKQTPLPYTYQKFELEWKGLRLSKSEDFEKSPDTFINQDVIDKVAKSLVTLPENFKPIKQIEKLLEERKNLFYNEKKLNWASAELLAYGSLLLEGKIVRLGGQDAQRGTFSHRHAVIHDTNTNELYCNLNHISPEQERCRIFNSFLSEYAALGFEYGYAMANPNALVIWEAQFGDFSNGAQVIIDQFISSGESKWRRMNGLVMLLPHGYEGQGPEHSSARLERFLQLSAENNIIVANVTLPANFFHLIRRQLQWEFRKPLVVMSPKSLLRNAQCISPIEDFTSGSFKEVIDDNYVEVANVKKLALCSGKVYFDLYNEQQAKQRKDVAIVRLEQLHPFPKKQVDDILAKYSSAKIYWVQEEPENMGSWNYILRMMRKVDIDIISRKPSASPASGYAKIHKQEQQAIVDNLFS